ncbi:MAG: group III truncated hemoglobin [Pseudomonadota bacterium]|nr:group III truncated hemoglobin [Pseudomonadota bacterium]
MEPDDTLAEADLERLVPAFYARVRDDALIGPVFNRAIDDWEAHLAKLTAFWSSLMLTSGRYKGQPVAAHLKHKAALTPEMFDRWLALWADVTSELLAAPKARALQDKAARVAQSLQLALWFHLPDIDASPSARQRSST